MTVLQAPDTTGTGYCRPWCTVDRQAEPEHGRMFDTCMSDTQSVPLSLAELVEVPGFGQAPDALNVTLLQDGTDDEPRIEIAQGSDDGEHAGYLTLDEAAQLAAVLTALVIEARR